MLEIREQILSIIKRKKRLVLSEEKALLFEIIEYQDNEFIYSGVNSLSNMEDFRYSLSPKQALAKICDYYRSKGNIQTEPGYKQVYAYMIQNV
jgi:hypothetical protein